MYYASFNLATVKHPLGLVSGYVKVTATFEAAKENSQSQPDKRLNVYFDKRYLSIEKIAGIVTPQLNPFTALPAIIQYSFSSFPSPIIVFSLENVPHSCRKCCKVVSANNPRGRVATLDITYLDESLRIGRGGDGSLFILRKSNAV